MDTIWAFDLGKSSIGEAVWNETTREFDHVASLLIPGDFASTKEAASRRRMMRTRLAHKAREAWLEEVWYTAGQKPLTGRRVEKVDGKWQLIREGDERLEREFPPKGENTCYTSCLLRIKLLRGEKLEPWQIYKALHSAIQKRGYDPDLAWKTRENRRTRKAGSENDDEGKTLQRMEEFEKELVDMSPDNEDHRLPCYFDAWKMQLWNPETDELKERITHEAESTRNRILPRWVVIKEIRLLVEAAAKLIPALEGKAWYVLYGPAGKAYASYYKAERMEHGLREGGETDWQGVLGQKVPRFDNRIIEKCMLMPRFNVCKVRSDENRAAGERGTLPQEVTFLMKLKNMRVQRTTPETGLTASEIQQAFTAYAAKGWKISGPQWNKFCASLGVRPMPPVIEVEAPKMAGRSRLCRPALEVMKRLILSGLPPKDFYAAEVKRLNGNTDPRKGLVETDLKFLREMGDTWEGIYLPNQKLESMGLRHSYSDAAIMELIGSQNDPIVRHRLGAFWKRLRELEAAHGRPKEIAIEFVREDFMGEKALIEYRKFLKERERARKVAREDAEAAGFMGRSERIKMELLRLQGGICLYTGDALSETSLDEYEIDHIVPQSQQGPDAMVNYVLTKKTTNDEKGNRTPHEWLAGKEGWDAYVNRVKSKQTALRHKKVRLLLLPEAAELAEKYTSLAETAWIAKLAQTLAGLQFGWNNGVDENGDKRVIIVSGGLTARIRRKYKLNSLLAGEGVTEEEAEKKNRDDDRHHALDAMVLAHIQGWARDPNKEKWFKFPAPIEANARGFFAQQINKVEPRNLHLAGTRLEATAYGQRVIQKTPDSKPSVYAVGRERLESLLVKTVLGKETLKAPDKADTKRIVDDVIRAEVEAYLQAHPGLTLEEWKAWCGSYRVKGKGPRVIKLLMTKSKADSTDEYVDVSKDGSGQLRRGETHRGYFVYCIPAPTKKEPEKKRAVVKPVYAFQSVALIRKKLEDQGIVDAQFFESGCTVEISQPVEHPKTPLAPGRYILNSIWEQGNVVVTSGTGKVSAPIGLAHMLNAGFRSVK